MPRKGRDSQRGLGMVEALIAMAIFALGMAALAAIYVRESPVALQNQSASAVQTIAESFYSTLTVDPSMLPLNLTGASAASQFPSALQDWFTQAAQELPGLSVSVGSVDDAEGNPCSSLSCGVQLSLSWQQLGERRTQVFHGQVGIR